MLYQVNRDVTPEECNWLSRTVKEGELVERFTGYTYGCITSSGTACVIDGISGFCELPNSCLDLIHIFNK